MKLSWRRGMAERALHYDATCHHFRVKETARGHAFLPKQQSPCPRAEPAWLGGSQRAPALTSTSSGLCCVSHQQPTQPSSLGRKPASDLTKQAPSIWKIQRNGGSFPGRHLHGDAVTALSKSGKGASLLQESTSISPRVRCHRG